MHLGDRILKRHLYSSKMEHPSNTDDDAAKEKVRMVIELVPLPDFPSGYLDIDRNQDRLGSIQQQQNGDFVPFHVEIK
jgi:hypothetical protein